MELVMSVMHFIGAAVAVILIEAFVLWFIESQNERLSKRIYDELAVKFGVSKENLESGELEQRVIEYLFSRFSSELLRNRISDLLGVVRKCGIG